MTEKRVRKLHDGWIDAGRRRVIARALHRDSKMRLVDIARLLGVTPETVRRYCR